MTEAAAKYIKKKKNRHAKKKLAAKGRVPGGKGYGKAKKEQAKASKAAKAPAKPTKAEKKAKKEAKAKK